MSFRSSSVPPEELRGALSDYLSLDRARSIRRLMVARFGSIAAIAGLVLTLAHLLSPTARVITIGLCLVPPLSAWIAEIGIERRLVQRIERLGGAVGPQTGLGRSTNPTLCKKVIKSS